MSLQLEQITLGTAPLGKDGDTNRTANIKTNANMAKIAGAIDGLTDSVAKKLDAESGGTVKGPVTLTNGGPNGSDVSPNLSAAAGKYRYFGFQTNGTIRWSFGVDNTPEAGSNGGSNFFLSRYSDAGAWLNSVLTIRRSDGKLTLHSDVECRLGLSLTQSNAGIELGDPAGANTPFIDFHSSGSTRDYDARIIADGGSSTSDGSGNLRVRAAKFALANTQLHAYGQPAGGWISIFQNGGAGTSWPLVFQNSAGAVVGSISANDSSVGFNTTSDYRLKQNYAPIADALESLRRIEFYSGEFIAAPGKKVDYCIAHELQEEMDFVVTGKKDAVQKYPILREGADPSNFQPDDVVDVGEAIIPQAVDYSKMVPRLGAAIKQLDAMLQEAYQRIEKLEARVK